MKLQIPRADAVAFGSLISALIVVVGELDWSHPAKVAVQAGLGFIAAIVVVPFEHPAATAPPNNGGLSPALAPVAGANAKPDTPPDLGEGGAPL